jgi:hypothetical protein
MKKLPSLSLLLAGCAGSPSVPTPEPRGAILTAPRMYVVNLPAGAVEGFDVQWKGDNRTRYTLPAGYDGFRFVGQGAGVTHVRVDNVTQWHDSAVWIGPFDGPVSLEAMTIHNGRAKAVHAGLATKSWNGRDYVVTRPVLPNFKVSVLDCEIVADPSPRPKWGLFGYQVDWEVRRTVIRWKEGVEHGSYEHGYSRLGSTWNGVDVESSGAEGSKVRNDSQEIQWVPGAKIVRRQSTFRDWYQPWSWRGGAGIVLQGTGCDIVIRRCEFYGSAGLRGRCISIDDGGTRVDGRPDYYDAVTGAIGGPYANGYVVIQECALFGGPGSSSYSDLMNVVNWHGRADYPHRTTRGLLMKDCGAWGTRMLGKFSASYSITGCNTELIRDYCASALGMDVSAEAMINATPLIPFSRGKTVVLSGDVLPSAEVGQ